MRKLRYGMVGGGQGAYIGETHRHAAQMDHLAVLTAGCFSRSVENSLATASLWGMADTSRIYATWQDMAEAESVREDGIDFVVIVTPNDSHYEIAKAFLEKGIHVLCDKPVTFDVPQAEKLARFVQEKDMLFGVTYGYTGYPAVRQAREMIARGDIGDIIHVRVSHPEDWVIESVSEGEENLPWRFHPERVGAALCTGDLGTHAEQLLVQFTGLKIRRLLAMLDTYPRHLPLETNTTVLLDLGNGVSGELWASQIAIGKACDPEIYVVGTRGALEWHHTRPDTLRYTPKGGPTQLWQTGRGYTASESRRLARVSAGHHEGFFEAFGNIYRSFCEVLLARMEGREEDGWKFPTIADGLDGMKFVAACVESHQKGNIWVKL